MCELNAIEEMREDIYMVLDDNGVWSTKEKHWMTEDELYALSDAEVITLYSQIYGMD